MAKRLVLVEIRVSPQNSKEGPFRSSTHLEVPSFIQDLTYTPEPTQPSDPQRLSEGESVVFVRGEIDELYLNDLREHPQVIAIWDDAPIEPVSESNYPSKQFVRLRSISSEASTWPIDCDHETPKGNLLEVAKYLGCDWIWEQGYRGKGIVIAICDTGINRDEIPVLDGWAPDEAIPFGQDEHGHGSMCATDALGIAPEVGLYDVGVLKGQHLLSDVLKGYRWIIEKYKSTGTPQVVSNSWALYQSISAPQYARNPRHPLTQRIIEAVDMGICVVFAAGNCGDGGCSDGRCGDDIGQGRSIWGVNGHSKVITVGAANIEGQWIGYSSQGPAALCQEKPDICAPSHFSGYYLSDAGTSAACPLCAGIVALVRQAVPHLSVHGIKKAINETAKDLCDPGWDIFSGFGMIDAKAAFNTALGSQV
jgi:serine protease AprX